MRDSELRASELRTSEFEVASEVAEIFCHLGVTVKKIESEWIVNCLLNGVDSTIRRFYGSEVTSRR